MIKTTIQEIQRVTKDFQLTATEIDSILSWANFRLENGEYIFTLFIEILDKLGNINLDQQNGLKSFLCVLDVENICEGLFEDSLLESGISSVCYKKSDIDQKKVETYEKVIKELTNKKGLVYCGGEICMTYANFRTLYNAQNNNSFNKDFICYVNKHKRGYKYKPNELLIIFNYCAVVGSQEIFTNNAYHRQVLSKLIKMM